jgi:hypothetical protein
LFFFYLFFFFLLEKDPILSHQSMRPR